jgi:hypothetical protein
MIQPLFICSDASRLRVSLRNSKRDKPLLETTNSWTIP